MKCLKFTRLQPHWLQILFWWLGQVCACQSCSEGVSLRALLLFCVQVVFGDWPEEQRDAIKRGHAWGGSLSFFRLKTSLWCCCASVLAFWVWRVWIFCQVLRLAETIFSVQSFFLTATVSEGVRVGRGKKLLYFTSFLFVFLNRKAGQSLVFYFPLR